jgi:hypothetical protein
MYQLVHRRCACSVLPTIICWGQLWRMQWSSSPG